MALFALARPLQVRYDEYIRLGFQPYMSTLNAGALTFTEFAMQESLPLATIHNAVLEFLRDRDDAVLFGAQAVNAYVHESRMTQDVDILATHAPN